MTKRRTIYFNDARHYYLFVFEPPMALEDAWIPVDEVAGTAVDTFIYGVARGDGLFYPSNVGMRFGDDMHGKFAQAAYWRVWHNMQSLIDRGLDPLTVLIDRAHDKGMDFFASLRMTGHERMNPAHRLESGGGGLAHPEVRDHQFAVLEELATSYPVEGVELDFALPGGGPRVLRLEDVPSMTPVMTEYVGKVSEMVRGRPGAPGEIGVRVLPTEEMNLAQGLDVRTWLKEGLVDFVAPLRYGYQLLDPNIPIDWLIEAAHQTDTSVYAMLMPYVGHESTGESERVWPTAEQMRAAVANLWSRGVDGMYTWFMRWPLGDTERRILTELGDPDLVEEGDKHYVLARSVESGDESHYESPLPIEIAASDTGTRHPVPFYIADDIEGAHDRIRQVRLKLRIYDLVSEDRLTLMLNGQSLESETCLRDYYSHINAYGGQRLEFHLKNVRPRKGQNLLEISLDRRAEGLMSPLRIDMMELIVEYGSYPSTLSWSPGDGSSSA